ncbi:MAG: YicC/YloC family endoribonuclease [Candidatus Bipolaricaulota bacterium]
MITSMTGFGQGSATRGGWRAEATLRVVNHRFLSIRIRSLADHPWLLAQVEDKLRAAFQRGEVGVWLSVEPDREADGAPAFDREVAGRVLAALEAACREFSLPDRPTLADLIRAGGLQTPQEKDEALWPAIGDALDVAAEAVRASRAKEGAALAAETERLLRVLERGAATVVERLPEIMDGVRARLQARVEELGARVDADRIETEIVLLADRFDVQEELVRLTSHLARVRELLAKCDGPAGKELDFLGQELLREVNTLGSKARDGEIVRTVVEMKVAIEQLREQIQNVE